MDGISSLTSYFVVLPFVVFTWIIVVAVRRGLELKQLAADGVDASGTVVRKHTFTGRRASRKYRLRYRYRDHAGELHETRSAVPESIYRSHEEGGPIAIMYSRSRPSVSAPKYLIDRIRTAKRKPQRPSTAQH